MPQGITPWMRGQWVVLEEALAAFEVFRSGQPSFAAEEQPETEKPVVEEHVPTPEELRMRPPSNPELDEQEKFESRIKEEMGEFLDESLLFASDKPEGKPAASLPFYDEDFITSAQKTDDQPKKPVEPVSPPQPEIHKEASHEPIQPPAPEPEPAKPPIPKPEPAQKTVPVEPKRTSEPQPEAQSVSGKDAGADVWKDEEIKRVKDALANPPKGDFAGHLTDAEKALQEEPKKPVQPPPAAEAKPKVTASAVVPTIPVQPKQPVWSPEAATATRNPVRMPPANKARPPEKPVKEVPSAPGVTPAAPTGNVKEPNTEDMEAIRTNITSGTMLTQTVDERIQDAMERAVELQKLGNTDQEVRSILERSSGLTPDEVSQVLKNLEKPEERRSSNRLLIIFLAAALLIFTILAWWFFSNQSTAGPGQASPGVEEGESAGLLPSTLIDAASLPEPLQTLVPNGLRLLNEPPEVEQSTAARLPAATCPRSQAVAASLFGGQASEWTQDSANNGWMMMTTRHLAEVKVPANMSAGYLVFERGPEMRSVTGPVIVKNIYMISVACE